MIPSGVDAVVWSPDILCIKYVYSSEMICQWEVENYRTMISFKGRKVTQKCTSWGVYRPGWSARWMRVRLHTRTLWTKRGPFKFVECTTAWPYKTSNNSKQDIWFTHSSPVRVAISRDTKIILPLAASSNSKSHLFSTWLPGVLPDKIIYLLT